MQKTGKQLNIVKSNGGFSLIEVIVALLMMAVITVPLLNMFALSAKTNELSAKQQAANQLGSLIMEEIQNQGIAEWGNEKGWDTTGAVINGSFEKQGMQVLVEAKASSHAAISVPAPDEAPDEKIVWNQYALPDFSSVDSTGSAIINSFSMFVEYEKVGNTTKAKLGDTYDDFTLELYRQQHSQYITEAWSNYVSSLPAEESPTVWPEEYKEAQLKAQISREIEIVVSDGAEGTAVVKGVIHYKLEHKDLNEAKKFHFGANWAAVEAQDTAQERIYVPDGWNCENSNGKGVHELSQESFFPEKTYAQIQRIYLFHIPMQGTLNSWAGDRIVLRDQRQNKKDGILHLVPQIFDTTTGIPTKVEIPDEWNVFYLSSDPGYAKKNAYLNEGSLGRIPSYDVGSRALGGDKKGINTVVDTRAQQNRLYDITVTIKNPKTGAQLLQLTLEGK